MLAQIFFQVVFTTNPPTMKIVFMLGKAMGADVFLLGSISVTALEKR